MTDDNANPSPIGAALGSSAVGAIYGLILYRLFVNWVYFGDLAVILTAFVISISFAGFTQYQRSIIGLQSTPIWYPTLFGSLTGGAFGFIDI
jgi:hypothetical protein